MNPFGDPVDPPEDAERKSQPWELPEKAPKPKPKRKSPKAPEDRLAEIEAKAEALRTEIEKERLGLRAGLVEDLLKKLQIDPIKGDLRESKRLGVLREKLGLEV